MFRLKNICKKYKSKKGCVTTALNNISLNFKDKGLVFILGKSGSGKSTLLNIIGGLDVADSGDIFFFGKNTKNFSKNDFDSYRNTYVGFIFQEFNLLEDYSVIDNIRLSLQLQRKKIDNKLIHDTLKKLNLDKLEYRKINELSGGQKQRVAIARALIKKPKIVLADEPTGNLDSITAKQVIELLKEISKNKLVIIVSHDNEMAFEYADRIIKIKDGHIEYDDEIKKVDYFNREEDKRILVKSNLPIRESIKLGINMLLSKKIRLVLTLILMIISLTFVGVSLTMSSFKYNRMHANLLLEHNEEYIYLQKGNMEEYEPVIPINVDEIDNIVKDRKYNILKMNFDDRKLSLNYESLGMSFDNGNNSDLPLYYASSSAQDINYIELSDENNIDFYVIGDLPISSNEIAVTSYIADHMIKYGIKSNNSNEIIRVDNYDDIINSNINFIINDKTVSVVGIIDFDMSKYIYFKDKNFNELTKNEQKEFDGINQTLIYKSKYLYNNIFVNSEFFSDADKYSNGIIKINNRESDIKVTSLYQNIVYYDGYQVKEKSVLSENEAILNINLFMKNSFNNEFIKYANSNSSNDIESLKLKFVNDFLQNNKIIGNTISIELQNSSGEYISLNNIEIVGVSVGDDNLNYFSSQLIDNYLSSSYKNCYIILQSNNEKEMEHLLDLYDFKDASDNSIIAKTPYSENIEDAINSLILVKTISSYASISLLFFSVLLIHNFISVSIMNKQKDIGILRSLGASKRDVLKIFLVGSMILVFISWSISSLLTFPIIQFLNKSFSSNLRFEFKVLFFNFKHVIELGGILFLLVFFSSFSPIHKISKKSPIDVINMK